MIGVIGGEKLPAPEPEHWQAPGSPENAANPFVIFGLIVLAVILRSALGRLVGALATGGSVGVVAWLVAGSLAASLLLAAIAFVVTLLAPSIAWGSPPVAPGRRGGWAAGGGGSWSSGSSGSSDSGGGGFSGGGGSFGGGGASGSW